MTVYLNLLLEGIDCAFKMIGNYQYHFEIFSRYLTLQSYSEHPIITLVIIAAPAVGQLQFQDPRLFDSP